MYSLEITEQDLDTISLVGCRYGWSDQLSKMCLEVGTNEFPEHMAWELHEAIESDMEGGHDAFPMLDSRSELAQKLTDFYTSVV